MNTLYPIFHSVIDLTLRSNIVCRSGYIIIHKATKQIWYIISKSHMCHTVLFLPNTQHNDGCNKEMYRTRELKN